MKGVSLVADGKPTMPPVLRTRLVQDDLLFSPQILPDLRNWSPGRMPTSSYQGIAMQLPSDPKQLALAAHSIGALSRSSSAHDIFAESCTCFVPKAQR